ncbi:MAG: group II intron reverse transcriptase/maturase [Acidobacteriota bacterium]
MVNQGGAVSRSTATPNPTGGVDRRRGTTQPSLHDDLMERVVERANLQRAWRRVKANYGAPGADGMTVGEFPAFVRSHWPAVRRALLEGRYQPAPVRRVSIPKPAGRGVRLLGIPTVTDRVICQAIQQVLTPIFDPGFSESSFGFRPGRSAHGALRQLQRHLREGRRVAVDLDLEKFFDRVDPDILMARVARKVRDKRLLALIGRYLRAGVLVGDIIQAREMGTPQGSPLSPLLANILLDDLDKELEKRGHRFVRYADDVLIVVRSVRAGERVKTSITRYLTSKLKLTVNEQKSRVARIDECVFLGFTFRGTKLRWSDEAFADFKHRVRRLTGRSWGVSMAYRLRELARYVRGWMNYFGISDYYRPIPELDAWIRRRIRMCYWKQWRRARTKVRHLLALGTGKREAILTAISRKSYWHLSRTLATQTGMTNAWLASQGLISVRDLWLKAHGYA